MQLHNIIHNIIINYINDTQDQMMQLIILYPHHAPAKGVCIRHQRKLKLTGLSIQLASSCVHTSNMYNAGQVCSNSMIAVRTHKQ